MTNNRLLASSYSLIIGDDLQSIWADYLLDSKVNILYFPIKQLEIVCSSLFIADLIKFLKQSPHVTCLKISSRLVSEIEDEKNKDTDEEYQFDNIEQLEIYEDIPWETVLCLVKYFPKLINLHVYCIILHTDLNDILGSFSFNDAAGTEYFRRVNRIKERNEQDQLKQMEMINKSNENLKSLGYHIP